MRDCKNEVQDDQVGNITSTLRESLIDPLRGEIVESEKARMDFLKYKLLAVAALGSIGLGLNINTNGFAMEHVYILGIIPLVCLYVDLLCYHNTLRIKIIGQYFADWGCCSYENYVSQVGEMVTDFDPTDKGADYFFEMEEWALKGSTKLLSYFITGFGIIYIFVSNDSWDLLKEFLIIFTLILPGFLGIVFADRSLQKFNRKKDILSRVAIKMKEKDQE